MRRDESRNREPLPIFASSGTGRVSSKTNTGSDWCCSPRSSTIPLRGRTNGRRCTSICVASPGNDPRSPSIALQCGQAKKRPGWSGSTNPGFNRKSRSPIMIVRPACQQRSLRHIGVWRTEPAGTPIDTGNRKCKRASVNEMKGTLLRRERNHRFVASWRARTSGNDAVGSRCCGRAAGLRCCPARQAAAAPLISGLNLMVEHWQKKHSSSR
jgi:hypothetical protein